MEAVHSDQPSALARNDGADDNVDDSDDVPALFGTETMAELFVRQGKRGAAIDIYRRLLAQDDGSTDRRERCEARLADLLGNGAVKPAAAPAKAPAKAPAPPVVVPEHRPPVVVRTPVRSGQIIFAERNDLIVLAPVNPGGQIVADGNIHIYAPMRGQAIAGAHGYADARIFCQRLEAELVAIGDALVPQDEMPRDRLGKPAQIFVQDGRCVIAPL